MDDLFFIASKTLSRLAMPDQLWLAVMLLGTLLLCTRLWRIGRGLVVGAMLVLAVAALTPIPDMAMRTLESRFRPTALPARVDGIVLLGGFQEDARRGPEAEAPFTRAAERFVTFVSLARAYPDAQLVFTGGSGRLVRGEGEAASFRALWETTGIPGRDVLIEDQSRNTWENAAMSHALVTPQAGQRWLVVTSAYHMPRAIGCFRAAGWPEPIPVPADWRARYHPDGSWEGPDLGGVGARGLEMLADAWREMLGLAAYWALGRTDAVFPAPNASSLGATSPGRVGG